MVWALNVHMLKKTQKDWYDIYKYFCPIVLLLCSRNQYSRPITMGVKAFLSILPSMYVMFIFHRRRVFAVFTKHSNQILNFVWTFLEDNGRKKIVLPWINLYDPFHAKRTKNACRVHKRHTLSLNLIHYIASRQEFKIPYRIPKSLYTMYWNPLKISILT